MAIGATFQQTITSRIKTGRRKLSDSTKTTPDANAMTWEEYRAYPAASQSDIKAAWSNPQLYEETCVLGTRPRKQARHLLFGRGAEEFLRFLRTDGHADCVQIIPDDVLTANGHRRGKAWEEYQEANKSRADEGVMFLTQKEYDDEYDGFVSALKNVREHDAACLMIFSDTIRLWSHRVIWHDEEWGIECKGEADIVLPYYDCLVDIKTSSDPTPIAFKRSVFEFGYHVQAAMYLRMLKHSGDDFGNVESYMWTVIRNKPPYDVWCYECSEDLIRAGERELEIKVDAWKRMTETGKWRPETHGSLITLDSYRGNR